MTADLDNPAGVRFVRGGREPRMVLLMGAFDPPTLAHLAILRAGARTTARPAAFCLTRTLLAREPDSPRAESLLAESLLEWEDRLAVLAELADRTKLGVVVPEAGTYLEVGRALRRLGTEGTFVVGSDKLGQLADPSFYPDGERGVAATFRELDLLVVPRPGSPKPVLPVGAQEMRWIPTEDVFDDSELSTLSATEVRRRIRLGLDASDLVPPEVARRLRGYTSAR